MVKSFSEWISERLSADLNSLGYGGSDSERLLSDALLRLERSLMISPQYRSALKTVQGLTDTFHIDGLEAREEIINGLEGIRSEIEGADWSPDEEDQLPTDDHGSKTSPISALNAALRRFRSHLD